MSQETDHLDDTLLAEIESHAAEIAAGGGAILRRHFGSKLKIEYKDERKNDPVTEVDKEAQDYLIRAIAEKYPDHGIVSEEEEDKDESVAPDVVWVLDPLDGTKNFIGGLPIFACSVGVLYRGAPAAGAIYLPWPGESEGVVMHARLGGGTFLGGERLSLRDAGEASGIRLVGLPGSFGHAFRFDKTMNGKVGELRISGSIAYEMAMVARGVYRYALAGSPHLWDVAAGAVLVAEAGGVVLMGRGARRRAPLMPERLQWRALGSFLESWQPGVTTLRELRRWSAPLVLGAPDVARQVADSLERKRPLRRMLTGVLRGRRGG